MINLTKRCLLESQFDVRTNVHSKDKIQKASAQKGVRLCPCKNIFSFHVYRSVNENVP